MPLLYQSVLKMFGSPGDLEKAQESFEQTAAWGTSMETLLMAQVGGEVLESRNRIGLDNSPNRVVCLWLLRVWLSE